MVALIYSYHITVIIIIILTALAAIGGMTKRGIFANVEDKYTKLLVIALLVELAGAFISVYTTLPELKLKVSQKYRFEISYNELVNSWEKKLSEDKMRLVQYFLKNGGLPTFYDFKNTIQTYEQVSELSKIGGTDWIKYYETKLSTKKDIEYINLYKEAFLESPRLVDQAEELLKSYTRKLNSSSSTGFGDMWAFIDGDKLTGIIVYEFPSDVVPTVLEFDGRLDQEKMSLSMQQKASAFQAGNRLFKRNKTSFNVELTRQDDIYVGELSTGPDQKYGDIRIQLWEL